MISMVKLWELAQDRRPHARTRTRGGVAAEHTPPETAEPTPPHAKAPYDLVILDAPATGHALALLRSPQLYTSIARVGPIARQARQVSELLEDPELSAFIGVAHATEMASSETLELRESLHRELGRELHAVLVNGSLPRRFDGGELRRITELGDGTPEPHSATTRSRAGARNAGEDSPPVVRAAARAARAVHERARSQQSQIARLRRSGVAVHTIPFSFRAELDLAAVQRIVDRLDRAL
jgi:anion-transporting  ArsA/GET3 family ATPase